MNIKNVSIAFGLTSTFYTIPATISEIKRIVNEGGDVYPVMSTSAFTTDTKFGKAEEFINNIEQITNKKIINNIAQAEEIEKDIMVIAPCSRK